MSNQLTNRQANKPSRTHNHINLDVGGNERCAVYIVALVSVIDYQYIDNTTRYDVRVVELLGHVSASLADREFIWVDNVCRCPRLDIGESYVVMGRLALAGPGSRETRLQITARSVAMPENMWEQRFASRNFNCRRRHNTSN